MENPLKIFSINITGMPKIVNPKNQYPIKIGILLLIASKKIALLFVLSRVVELLKEVI